MKSNEIIAEGPLDYIKNTAKNLGQAVQSGGIQGFKQNQAVDRRNSNYEARLQRNVKIVARKWDSKERSMPNRAALHNDPQAYYGELIKFLDKDIKAGQTGNLAIPDIINPKNTNDIITKFSQKAFPPTRLPGEAPAATEPAATKPVDTPAVTSEPKKGFYKNIGLTPAQKNAMALTRAAKGIQTGSTGTSPAGSVSEPAAAPAASTPTSTAAAPAATSTLPTKAKSNTKAKDIDIDAALKMADTLSPEEKKKLLQDLLKSGVTVKAGGA